MLRSTDLFSSSVGHGLINLPLADVWNRRNPAILRDVPPSLRDAAIPHHCPATSAAHRARLVLTSTRVIGRNAQGAALTGALGERSISVPLLPFPAKSRQVKVEGGTAVRENTANASVRPEAGGAGLPGAKPQQRGTEKRRRVYSGIRLKPLGTEDPAKTDPDYMAPEP